MRLFPLEFAANTSGSGAVDASSVQFIIINFIIIIIIIIIFISLINTVDKTQP